MSLSQVRSFFRTRLNGLGYKEHSDAFDDENRPQQLLDKLYRIEQATITGGPANHTAHSFDYDFNLVISLKGKKSNVDLLDRAYLIAEEILNDVLQESVRVGTDLKDIIPGTISVTPYTPSDDNDLLLSMGFTVTVICQF